jgi:hypothetical protein
MQFRRVRFFREAIRFTASLDTRSPAAVRPPPTSLARRRRRSTHAASTSASSLVEGDIGQREDQRAQGGGHVRRYPAVEPVRQQADRPATIVATTAIGAGARITSPLRKDQHQHRGRPEPQHRPPVVEVLFDGADGDELNRRPPNGSSIPLSWSNWQSHSPIAGRAASGRPLPDLCSQSESAYNLMVAFYKAS